MNQPLRIGIDVNGLSNRRGFGRFTRELLAALVAADHPHTLVLFADRQTAEEQPLPEGIECLVAPTRAAAARAASSEGRRRLRDVLAMSRLLLGQRLDLFYFPASYLYFPVAPTRTASGRRTRVVLTMHDAPYPDMVFLSPNRPFFWRLKLRLSLLQAHHIVTVSEFSRAGIVRHCGLPPERVSVICEGAHREFRPLADSEERARALARHGLSKERPFLLYVGGFNPNKNVQLLITAFAALAGEPAFTDLQLVLTGDRSRDPFHSDYPALARSVTALRLTERVHFTDFVPDAELPHLYNAAQALVFPSLIEGFGLPVLEAMACGTPVIASRRASLPEVLGSAGRYFDPDRVDTLVTALRDVLTDATLRDELRSRGLAQSRRFGWEQAAQQLLSVFERVAHSR